MAERLAVCVILDRSGSMADCRSDAIGAVNGYLRQLRADNEVQATVSVIIFDSDSIDLIRDRVPTTSLPEITDAEYEPRGMTPLFDAVAHGVGVLEKSSHEAKRSALVIMTDGLENASREHSKSSIRAVIDRKQKEEGWLVIYLGADHDAWSQAQSLGVFCANAASFQKSALSETPRVLSARSLRYARSKSARADIEAGFLEEERASISDNGERKTGKN